MYPSQNLATRFLKHEKYPLSNGNFLANHKTWKYQHFLTRSNFLPVSASPNSHICMSSLPATKSTGDLSGWISIWRPGNHNKMYSIFSHVCVESRPLALVKKCIPIRPDFSLGLLLKSTWFVTKKWFKNMPNLILFSFVMKQLCKDFLTAVNKIRSDPNS